MLGALGVEHAIEHLTDDQLFSGGAGAGAGAGIFLYQPGSEIHRMDLVGQGRRGRAPVPLSGVAKGAAAAADVAYGLPFYAYVG